MDLLLLFKIQLEFIFISDLDTFHLNLDCSHTWFMRKSLLLSDGTIMGTVGIVPICPNGSSSRMSNGFVYTMAGCGAIKLMCIARQSLALKLKSIKCTSLVVPQLSGIQHSTSGCRRILLHWNTGNNCSTTKLVKTKVWGPTNKEIIGY
ncbi:hypothetical protein O3M35_009292 [Rhynocoris fuscipes]|uniref:Uncharacterized protein n=1 Tax=Rhynocoris fuscipes TaxID=488301 RepID=A0AAW1D5D3_9HEMI